MNKKDLIEQLEELKLVYNDYYYLTGSDVYVSDEEVISSKEYKDEIQHIIKPELTLDDPLKLDEVLEVESEQPIKPEFNPPFKYNDSLHEVEFMSYKECFPESLKDISDRETKKEAGLNIRNKDDEIKKIIISAIFTLLTFFLLGFPYIFNWHISAKIILTIIGVIILSYRLLFEARSNIFIDNYSREHKDIIYREQEDNYYRDKGIFKKIFLWVPLIFHIWNLVSGNCKYKFVLHKMYSYTIEERKKYLNYYFPDWYGYPYRVSDLDKDEFKLLYSNEELNQNYGSNDKKGFPFCDGVDKNELVIFPIQSVIEHMKNPKRLTEYGSHYAPGNYWTYRDNDKEYHLKLETNQRYDQIKLEEKKKLAEYNKKIGKIKDKVRKILKKKKEADRQEKIAKIETAYREKIAEIERDYPDEYIGEKYYYYLDEIIELIKSGRADTVKEAINLFEEMKYKERQLEIQREKNQKIEYCVFVNTYDDYHRVNVVANSEAEAINAAMNMVEGSVRARIESSRFVEY